MNGNPLTVAGAATVLAPFRVVLTVFPINPLRSRSGNRRYTITLTRCRRQAGLDGYFQHTVFKRFESPLFKLRPNYRRMRWPIEFVFANLHVVFSR